MTSTSANLPATPLRSSVFLLYAARGVRGLGDGFAIIILPAYLSALGFSPVHIGFIATASLLGTALLTLTIGFVAPRHDMRNLLLAGAGLMVGTGLAFPNFESLALIAVVAFVGTINPATGDLGVLVPIEHAMLAQGVPDRERTTVVRFKSVAGKVDQAGGIAVRLSDPDNYYIVRANALEDNVRFYHVIGGRRTELKGANLKVAAHVWHTLGLKAEIDLFTVTFDGKELFTATDRSITGAGKVALWTKSDSVTRFDRIEIKSLP